MSRETNSVLLRYGINTFWSSSSNFLYLSTSFFQFYSFISLFLRNYFLKPLKIQFSFNSINLYLFYFKEHHFSFLYKYLKLKKIILNKLAIRKIYALNLKKKGVSKKKIRPNFLILFSLVNKVLFLKFLYVLFNKKSVSKYSLPSSVSIFIRKKQLKKKKLLRRRYNKIKLINSLLKYKLLGLKFSFLTAFYLKKEFFFNLRAVLRLPVLFNRVPFFFKYFQNQTIKSKIYLIFLSFFFFRASILTAYINTLIQKTKNKKHLRTLILFFNFLNMLFKRQIIPLSGFKFKIAGRLGGKLRKASFGYQSGALQLQTFNIIANYSCDLVFTQFGCFSLKFWLLDSNLEYQIQ